MKGITIDQYIQKHELIERKISSVSWIPVNISLPEDDKGRFFSNDDGTHVVVMNDSKKLFKIYRGDMISLHSEWMDSQVNYSTDARPFWKKPIS